MNIQKKFQFSFLQRLGLFIGSILLLSFQSNLHVYANELTAVAGIPKPMKNWRPNTFRKIQLSGAKGETLSFLMHFPISLMPSSNCLELQFKSIQNNVPHGISAHFYFLPPITLEQPSFVNGERGTYYDPVIPLEENRICPAHLQEGTHIQQEGVWLYGELRIAEQILAGNYFFQVQLGQSNPIDIDVNIWKMIMPVAPTLPMYTEFSSFWAATGHYGRNIENEGLLAKRYISEMVQHHLIPLRGWVARPPVVSDPQSGLPIYDFKNFPTPETSFESLYIQQIPGRLYIDFPKEKLDMRPDEKEIHWQTLQRTLRNYGLQNRSLVYLGDEPQHDWEMNELIKQSERIKNAMPGTKIFIKTKYYEPLKNSASIWAPVLHPFSYPDINTAFDLYRALQRQGQEFWSYVSCVSHGCTEEQDSGAPDFVIDRAASYIRSLAWLARWYKMDALTYHHSVFGFQFYPARDPWKNLFDQTGNGDGTLFYPGRPGVYALKEHQPISSLRLKIWREASYDAQYIQWIQESSVKPEGWESKFYYLVRNMIQWNRDYYAYQNLRNQMGEFLNLR